MALIFQSVNISSREKVRIHPFISQRRKLSVDYVITFTKLTLSGWTFRAKNATKIAIPSDKRGVKVVGENYPSLSEATTTLMCAYC